MFDIVSVGNATVDVFIELGGKAQKGKLELPTGTKQEVKSITYGTGGGATNTAVGFKRLGLRTGILAAVGKDLAGKMVLDDLRQHRVSTRLITRLRHFSTAYSAILTGFGQDRIILTYGGATTHLGEERSIHWAWLKQTRWVHLSSFHAKPRILKKVLEFAESNGISVSFNPGMSEITQGINALGQLLKKVDVLLLNRNEAAMLTGKKDVKGQLKKLQEIVPLVVVTEGSKGAHSFDGKNYYMKPAYKVRLADTTGAGDAFHSGFVAAIARGLPVESAMEWGNANAQSVIMHLGAKNKLLALHEIEGFIKRHETAKTRLVKKAV